VGALDLPSEPEEPGRADHARDQGADRPNARDVPDPDARGRAYEAARTHVSVEAAGEAGPVGPPEGSSYWHRASGFADQAADYRKRWSADGQTVPDRSADPPGSFRSDGGSYLNPDRHAEAVMAIGRVREAEPAISADMRTIERENRHGGWLEGFDRRIKGDDRLKEKVAEQLKAEPRMTAGKVLHEVPDAIRYTFCLEPGGYAKGYYGIAEQLANRGYEMYLSKNSWTDSEYKGINTRWVTPDGQRFEVQFHTPESFHAKQYVTHDAYERIRNPMISDRERKELKDFQREVSSAIQAPNGAAEISDYKKKGF
jgi:hypothetical protein